MMQTRATAIPAEEAHDSETINETVERVRALLPEVAFEDYTFHVYPDREGAKVQATYPEEDVVSGRIETQYTRKWLVSPYAVKSEIVKTLFKLCATSAEHRLREHFLYRGRRIFGPHIDVDVLWEASRKIDVRKDEQGQKDG